MGKRAGVWYGSGGVHNIEVPSVVMGRQSLWGIDECKWVTVMGECVLFVSHFSRSFTGGGSKDRGTLQTLSHSAGSIKYTQQRRTSNKKTDTSKSSVHLCEIWP